MNGVARRYADWRDVISSNAALTTSLESVTARFTLGAPRSAAPLTHVRAHAREKSLKNSADAQATLDLDEHGATRLDNVSLAWLAAHTVYPNIEHHPM
jgi:hypothetical protein